MDSEGLSDEGDTPAGDAADFYQEMFNILKGQVELDAEERREMTIERLMKQGAPSMGHRESSRENYGMMRKKTMRALDGTKLSLKQKVAMHMMDMAQAKEV